MFFTFVDVYILNFLRTVTFYVMWHWPFATLTFWNSYVLWCSYVMWRLHVLKRLRF